MAIVGLLALAAFPVAVRALPGQRRPALDRANLEYLAQALPADAVVVTDEAPGVAWYSDRIAVWIPYAPTPTPGAGEPMLLVDAADPTQSDGYKALARAEVEPDAIFLSSELKGYASTEGVGRWQLLHDVIAQQLDAIEGGQEGTPWVPTGWTLAASLPPRDVLLLPSDMVGREGSAAVEAQPEEAQPEEAQPGAEVSDEP